MLEFLTFELALVLTTYAHDQRSRSSKGHRCLVLRMRELLVLVGIARLRSTSVCVCNLHRPVKSREGSPARQNVLRAVHAAGDALEAPLVCTADAHTFRAHGLFPGRCERRVAMTHATKSNVRLVAG